MYETLLSDIRHYYNGSGRGGNRRTVGIEPLYTIVKVNDNETEHYCKKSILKM